MKRYQCHDEEGLARSFDTKADALEWMKARPELTLVVIPMKRKKKPMQDVFKLVGECLI